MKNIDQLLNALEGIRRQKAELDKQEKAVIEDLKQKLKMQEERVRRIGIDENKPVDERRKDPEVLIPPGLKDVPKDYPKN